MIKEGVFDKATSSSKDLKAVSRHYLRHFLIRPGAVIHSLVTIVRKSDFYSDQPCIQLNTEAATVHNRR